MKLRLAALCCLTFVACARDLGLPDPPPTTAFITGRVISAVPGSSQSVPVKNASVSMLNTNLSAVTDERGVFNLGPVPESTYRLFFTARTATGTRQRIVNGIRAKPGSTNNLGDISLQENALLTGRSLIQGRTAGNIGITIFSPGTDYVTTSADNGGWLLTNLPEGTIRATAWRPGFVPATTTDIDLQGGVVTSAVDLVLEPENMSAPPGSIEGSAVVMGHDDSANVTVKAISTTTREVRGTVVTGADGKFVLANLASDLYLVTLELDGYPSARIPNLAISDGVQLELDPVVMAVVNDGNAGRAEPIGGPSGPLFNLDGGITSPDGGTVMTDGGTIGAECEDDNDCASGRLCIDNRCVGCSVNVQCRPGYSCQAGDCVRDCMDNAECPSGLACIAGACVGCITSSDCRDPALVCNGQSRCAHCTSRNECPVGKACLPGGCGDCSTDGDCGAGAICEQGVCTAGNCHSNADCALDQACVGRTCSACGTDNECRAGQLCINSACVVGDCRSVLDCAAGQLCQANLCGACANDPECGAGRICLPGANGLRCTAGTCHGNGDCVGASAGFLCVNNGCVACSGSNPCPSGNICNSQGRCVIGDCFSNLDCTGPKAGFACIGGNCTPCSSNMQCAASGYVCVSGQCRVGNCVTANDCALQGQLCINNACVGCSASQPCPNGQVCDTDSLCHLGNCLASSDCSGGQVCINRACTVCGNDAQCGAGKLCLGGSCVAGNCRTPADCPTGQVCLSNACAPCTNSGQCTAGNVCDTDGLCHPGNCTTTANCAPGQLCLNRTCSACTMDTQCAGGQICFNGACVSGTCHGDSDCSGGTQLCNTSTHLCQSCAPTNQLNNAQCGGAGHVCDSAGFCRVGTCRTNGDCSAVPGQVCVNFNCSTCTQDSQCNSGQLCIANSCKTGNCHGTGPNPNVDCDATNGVCVNNVCTGNCRDNSNCPATGLCNLTTHTCTTCTGGGQCGVGRVCHNPGSGNQCVTGTCSALEANCGFGEACLNNQCVQVGPNTTPDGGMYVEDAGSLSNARGPLVISGADTLYMATALAPNSNWSIALDPNLNVRWKVRDSTGGQGRSYFGQAGLVLPAPGFPNDELFVVADVSGGTNAHRSDNGAIVWSLPVWSQDPAAGLINGVPYYAGHQFSGNTVFWVRADGQNFRTLPLSGCGAIASFSWGSRGMYAQCQEGLFLIDPASSTVKIVPNNGNPSLLINGGSQFGVFGIWRPPNNYVARGVNSGTVSSDLVLYGGNGNVGGRWLLAVNVPDDWVTNSSSTSTWTVWGTTAVNFAGHAISIDSTGAATFVNTNAMYKVNIFTGAIISQTGVPSPAHGGEFNAFSNNQNIEVQSNQLQGYVFADGVANSPAPTWTLPTVPGNFLSVPAVQRNLSSSGNLVVVQNNSTGQPTVRALAPADGGSFYAPPPTWSQAGNPSNQNTAPAYQCTTNAQCASTETCMFGRCAGQCRTANQCSAGQGCALTTCGVCSAQSHCRSGEVCWAGGCIACTGMGCCNTSADCTGGGFCQSGQCRTSPASGGPGSFALANQTPASQSANITATPDGTLYLGSVSGSTPSWKVVTLAGGVTTTASITPGQVTGGGRPLLTAVTVGPTTTMFFAGMNNNNLYSAPASSSIGSWTTSSYSALVGTQHLAQTMSTAFNGMPRATLAMTGATNFSGGSAVIAVDVANAAVGGANAGLLWVGAISSTCSVSGVGGIENLLVGSDGTIYVVCSDSSVTAWAADGDPTSGAPPNRLGLLKWRTAAVPGWTSGAAYKPAIGKTASGDVLYLSKFGGTPSIAVLNLATATNGTVPTEVFVDGTTDILTDNLGRAVTLGTGTTKQIAVVSPTGTVLADQKFWAPAGSSHVLTAEGQLIFPDTNSGGRIVGVFVNPPQIVDVFAVTGAGNLAPDQYSGVMVLPVSASVPNGMLSFDHQPAAGTLRSFSVLSFPSTTGQMPNAWSMSGADPQRRFSLKTQ
ncbi:MAG: carboxypeptidase-like regulatory domain-containing protein [Archangium sp.]